MQRYFINEEAFKKNIIEGDDVFHIRQVMKNRIGEEIIISCDHRAYLVKIESITNDYISYKIIKELEPETQRYKITLIQGIPKGDKLDEIIKHSTELGASKVIVAPMERSIVKWNDKKEQKIERYQKIAKSAAALAQRDYIPEISYQTLKEINYSEYDLKILLDEEEAYQLKGNNLSLIIRENWTSVCFVVGPEGGIAKEERLFLQNNGFTCCSLGKNILRTETASLALLSILYYEKEMIK